MAKKARFSKVSAIVAFCVLSGCAHVRTSSTQTGDDKGSAASSQPRTVGEVIQQSELPSQTPPGGKTDKIVSGTKNSYIKENGEIVVEGIKLKNTQFDIPITINSRVEYWVDYFCGRGRKFFEKYLERSEFFIPYIVPILKQSGMPEDLVYLAMIESGFNNFAKSRAKAVGPWQFISATGKRYGLMVNWWVDERRDIRKSTIAAVEYLRDLNNMFQSWELAAAAYNAGEAKIARAIQRFGSKDFWVVSQHRFLRPETRDYVPKIIAAALIAKNRAQFGFPESSKVKPGDDEAIAGDGEVVKVVKTDKPEERVEAKPGDGTEKVGDLLTTLANAKADEDLDDDDDDEEETGKSASGPSITPATLLVPADNGIPEGQQASNGGLSSESGPLAKPVPTPHLSKDGTVGGEELVEFDVRGPADLLKVARAAGLSYQTIKSLNPELLRWCTPPSIASYRLKLPASVKDKFLATYNHSAYPREVKFMTYKVRRGETLTHVARHFGIKVDPISDLNGVSARMPLRRGVEILLPIPNDRSRSLASLDVRDPPEHRRGRRHRRSRYYKISYKKRESARVARPAPGEDG